MRDCASAFWFGSSGRKTSATTTASSPTAIEAATVLRNSSESSTKLSGSLSEGLKPWKIWFEIGYESPMPMLVHYPSSW